MTVGPWPFAEIPLGKPSRGLPWVRSAVEEGRVDRVVRAQLLIDADVQRRVIVLRRCLVRYVVYRACGSGARYVRRGKVAGKRGALRRNSRRNVVVGEVRRAVSVGIDRRIRHVKLNAGGAEAGAVEDAAKAGEVAGQFGGSWHARGVGGGAVRMVPLIRNQKVRLVATVVKMGK